MSTHNIGFYEEIIIKLSLIYHQILSNTHLISSADNPNLTIAYCGSKATNQTSKGLFSLNLNTLNF